MIMKIDKSSFLKIIKRKEILLFVVLFVASLSLIGWIEDKIIFASVFSNFIPIAPSTALLFFILSILLISNYNFEKSRITQSVTSPVVFLVALFCLLVLLDYIFNFTWDIENIFIANPERFENISTGRMSPITSLLFLFTCLSILAGTKHTSNTIKYIGGSFSLLTCFIAIVLFIGYLYKAPLLYGSQIIPVALPTAICFLLFSVTLLRISELKFWTFNLIKENPAKVLLLKTFLPIVVFVVVLQGFLETNYSIHHNDPTLTSAIVILIIVAITILIVIRASAFLGNKLLRAEKKLRESEELSRYLLQTIPFGMDIVDENGTVLFQSENLKKLFGDEAIGNKCWKLYCDDKAQCSGCPLKDGIKVGITEVYESAGVLGGKIFEIFHTGMMFEGKKAMLEIFIDISERKLAEEALVQEQYLMRTLMDNLPDHIYFKDHTSRFVRINKSHAQFFGLSDPMEAVGKTDFDFFTREHAQQAFDDEQSIMRTGQMLSIEEREARLDRPDIWISTIKLPLRDKEGNLNGTFGISRDITERRQAVEEIKLKNKELQKTNAEKDKFFSIIAHDLRSPFNSLIGITTLMVEELPTFTLEETRKCALNMKKSAEKLYNLLENLLEWSQMQRGLLNFNPKSFILLNGIATLIEMARDAADKKMIRISWDVPEELRIKADVQMFESLMRNLVFNAIKFTPKNGGIVIKAKPISDTFVEISIKDTGIGMNQYILDNLFRLDVNTSRPGTEGESFSGLGLIISKDFIEKHGGQLLVESEEGKGSTFYFTLPYNYEPQEEIVITNVVSAYDADNLINSKVSALKILVVEDDEISEMLISSALKSISYEVLKVTTGIEAIETCRNNPDIDLILMDIQMPEMSGYEATRHIRQFNKDVIIIAQTAFGLAGDKEKAIEAGCNDYIAKPLNLAALKRLIQKYDLGSIDSVVEML